MHTQLRLEAGHSPQEYLAHLTQVHWIIEEFLREWRKIYLYDAILGSTQE